MAAELGPDWEAKFAEFAREPPASASLGQVHKRPKRMTARSWPCKLQYPDMQSAVEADLNQLGLLLAIHKRLRPGHRHLGNRDGNLGAAARGARL